MILKYYEAKTGAEMEREHRNEWLISPFFNAVPQFSMQGSMFGYATDETEECMPLTVLLAHKLTASIRALERNGTWPWVRPDGKTQVCIRCINYKGEKQQK